MKINFKIKAIFGIVCISLVLTVQFIPLSQAIANPFQPPSSPEKEDISRGKIGYTNFPEIASSHTGQSAAVKDLFGYTVSPISYNWFDATGGTKITFPSRDDDYYKISLGFNFPFYENTYSNLFVSTNGIITFGQASDAFENRVIPRDTLPNNFIAPFWDDLIFTSSDGQAYYKKGENANGKYIVIEWNGISRLETPKKKLIFEVILYENGDIRFQYKKLEGPLDQSTVGIEDEHGVDGSLYLYNFDGLSESSAILFEYPSASARTKIYPKNQGKFISAGFTNLQFKIRNTGDLGKDTYDFSLSSFPPTWEVKFYDGKHNLLKDTNKNGKIDTGPLPQDAEMVVNIRVRAPDSGSIGESINVTLSAVSSRNPGKKSQATFDAAIPTGFAQALLSGGKMRLHLVWRENQISALASPEQFSGSNLAVQRLVNGNYLYSWEQNSPPDSAVSYTDLKFTILSPVGGSLIHERSLTNNAKVTEPTEDRFLVSATATSNGRVGVMWVRTIYRFFAGDTLKLNQNVFFAVLDKSGKIIIPTRNITNNTGWWGESDLGVPSFMTPKITVTNDDRFILAWTKTVEESGGKVSNIEYAIYDINGIKLKSKTSLTAGLPGGIYYITPTVERMGLNRALISYSKNHPTSGTASLVYQILDSNGNIKKGETSIDNTGGATAHDSVRLGGSILLAWPSALDGKIGFILLDGETATTVAPTQFMTSPNLRDATKVSVARDNHGRGIITWSDANQSQYLYYAMVSGDGTKVTPEMMFLAATGSNTLNTNAYGYGLASYEGTWQVLLPAVTR
ncbi:nidogen-like domain-containing protein [Chloroflexota bacterium]